MYLLDFWEQNLTEELENIFNSVKNFFIDIGLEIYESLVNLIGETPAKMTLMVLIIAIILFSLLKFINR